MLKLQIPKNRMNYLIKQIPLHFDAVVLEQGWEYYHKGRVTEVDLKGMNVQATVAGKKILNTMLNLENFATSECSCSYDGFCKHIGATFFSLYAPYGRPELLLQQLKQQIHTRKKPARGAALIQERKAAAAAQANVPLEEAMPSRLASLF